MYCSFHFNLFKTVFHVSILFKKADKLLICSLPFIPCMSCEVVLTSISPGTCAPSQTQSLWAECTSTWKWCRHCETEKHGDHHINSISHFGSDKDVRTLSTQQHMSLRAVLQYKHTAVAQFELNSEHINTLHPNRVDKPRETRETNYWANP